MVSAIRSAIRILWNAFDDTKNKKKEIIIKKKNRLLVWKDVKNSLPFKRLVCGDSQ